MSQRTYRLFCLSTAISPITHAQGSAGNESLLFREPVVTPQGVRHVPALSGNALRNRLIRDPGAQWLTDELGLFGTFTRDKLAFLFNGGNNPQAGGRENTRIISDLRRLFPLLRVLGGNLPNQIVGGYLQSRRGTLVCRENAQRLRELCPFPMPETPLRPAESFVSGYQYTRGDKSRQEPQMLADGHAEMSGSALMIFSGQAVTAGAIFVHEFILRDCSELDLGAILLSMQYWRARGATVGGMSGKGHGVLDTMIHVDPEADTDAAVKAYTEHIRANRDACRALLDEALRWEDPEEKAAKKGKAKKAG